MAKNQPMEQLTSGSIPKIMNRLFIPASVGFFFNVLYNIVDTYFGGKISPETLAGLSISFPIFFIIIALVFGFSSGCSALIATEIGKGDKENAKHLYCQSISFGFFLAIFTSLIGIIFTSPLLKLLGAANQYATEASNYLLIIFYGAIFIVGVGIINAGLSALGQNKPNRNFLIASFFSNILLDYWFIYGGLGIPPLGVQGIGLATVVVHVFGILYLLYHVRQTFLLDGVNLKTFIPKKEYYLQILSQGLPATFNMLSISIYFFIINRFLTDFGQEAVAAYGIGLRIEQLILVPGVGLGIAISTIVAQNHGANIPERVNETIKVGMIYSLSMMTFGCLFLLLFGEYIMQFFTGNKDTIAIGVEYLRIEAFTLFSYSFTHISASALQGLKKPNISSVINLIGRFTPLPVLLILIDVYAFSTPAVWWTILINSWLMGITFFLFLKLILKKTFP